MSRRKQLLQTIKSWGYWMVNFKPLTNQQLQLSQCREIVEESTVELRGWDYPHIPKRRGDDTDLTPGNDFYEGWIDWGAHKEIWRMYQSGQFIHYRAMEEDWFQEDDWYGDLKKKEPGTILSIISAVYLLTEVFEFLVRLIRDGLYKEGVEVNIQLNNGSGRKLEVLDPMRAPLFREYTTGTDVIEFPSKKYTADYIVGNSKELALSVALYIFQRFDWNNPPVETIKNDQEELLARRL